MRSSKPDPGNSPMFLGIDVGTSGIRAILIDINERVIAEARTGLPRPTQRGEAIEQEPQLWWQGTKDVLQQLGRKTSLASVRALAVDGTSSTVLLADETGQPLHAALMYNDNRARNQLAKLRQLAPADSPVHSASSGLAKILWLCEQPFAAQARYALHQADWIAGKLVGHFGFSDPNNAVKSGYDALHGDWPDWLHQLPGIASRLPEVLPQASVVGIIDAQMAEDFDFAADTRIITGTTDSTASFLATGASRIGEAVTALGSTLVMKIITARPITDMRYGIYSQPLGDYWLVGGASNSGGAVLDHFFSHEQMAQLELQLQPDTTTGLNYYPLLGKGERFPINDPQLEPRLTPRPENDGKFFQALLEGIAAIEKLGYERLVECGTPWPSSIRTTGGGSQNSAWTKIRARLLNVAMQKTDHSEAAFGSARLARQAMTTRSTS